LFQVLEYLLDMSEVDIDGNDTLAGDTALCSAAAAGQKLSCDVLVSKPIKRFVVVVVVGDALAENLSVCPCQV
jgi:hypothetical protein